MNDIRSAILRTLCFHAAWEYAPTLPELMCGVDFGPSCYEKGSSFLLENEIQSMCTEKIISELAGRYGLPDYLTQIVATVHDRDILQPRKRRLARMITKLLSRMSGVRFVALANTAALGKARDKSDIDFFIITRAGRMWTTRLCIAGPLRFLGMLPRADERPDAICLSYFITDAGLDLSTHMLPHDDPYYRHWFMSLVPLFDDGIGTELWKSNSGLIMRHPFAMKWMSPPDLEVHIPRFRLRLGNVFESLAQKFQKKWFPKSITDIQNTNTNVLVCDTVLKFHVGDRREKFKSMYIAYCSQYDIQP